MSFPAYQEAIRQWLVHALPGKTIIMGRQNAPKPDLTFGTIKTLALTPVGSPDYLGGVPDDLTGIQYRWQQYRASLSVQFFGSAAETCAQDAHMSLGEQSTHDAFIDAGVSFEHAEALTEITELVDARWESRWTFDVFVGMIATGTEDIGWIEHVEVEATIIGSKTTVTEFEAGS